MPGWIVLLATLGATPIRAQTTPIPTHSAERVYAVGVRDEFGGLREEITRLERESDQTYHVVVLRSAGPGRRALRDYLDALLGRWEQQVKRGLATFDERRGVVIVVDVENRRIIVLGGQELQERYGFRDPYIERELLEPHFYPDARSGNLDRALRRLVTEIDRWIADRDRELARRREEIAAREERLRADARSALESGRGLRDEARRQLDARGAEGLAVAALEPRFREASGDLDAAGERVDTAPGESLDLAQRGRRGLQALLDSLRRLSVRQAENDARLQAASTRARQVFEAIEGADRLDLPTEAVRREYEAATGLIEQARGANGSEPDRAAELLNAAERALNETLAHAASLPDLAREASRREAAVEPLERDARSEVERARAAGSSGPALEAAWTDALGRLATARDRVATDLRSAVAGYEAVEGSLHSVRSRAASAADRRRFATRTLPALALGLALASAGATLAWSWLRRNRARQGLESRFRGFREHAVGLMERLDALRARHGRLAAGDPDFAEPMTGATLALYQEVEAALNRLWDRWLRVMDAWARAQSLSRAGSTFRAREFDEARGLLEREGNFEEITAEVESCRARVERLDQAHERAREALAAFEAEGVRFRQGLDRLRAANLAPASYRAEFDPIEAIAGGAEPAVTADPIGAGEALDRAREALDGLNARLGRVEELLARSDEVRRAIEGVASRAAGLRAGGLLLDEEAADPGPRLDAARRLVEAARVALREADTEEAGARLDEAGAAVADADAGIDRHLAAREAVARDREALLEAEARLDRAAEQAARLLEDLAAGFDPKSWRPVAGNLAEANALRDEAAGRLAEADRLASDAVQAYLLASDRQAEAAGRVDRAGRLLAALGEFHADLSALADEVREAARGLDAEMAGVARFFDENRDAIGPEAGRSREEAEGHLRRLAEAIRRPRPDWPDLRARVESLRRGLAVAREQAEADAEGSRRAAERLEQVRRRAQQVGAMLAREHKDRPPANQRHAAAVQELAELEREARGEPGSWDRQLRRLDEVAANLDRAEAMAGQDIRTANVANAEIAEAARVIRNARAYYQSGIVVEVGPAEAQLNRARAALKAQAYEQAIEMANAAEHRVREDFDKAAYAARRRQMSAQRGRAFSMSDALVIAAAQAAGHLAGRWIESMARGGGSDRSGGGGSWMSSGGGSRMSSGGGSWDSGSSGGSRTGGAGEGRW